MIENMQYKGDRGWASERSYLFSQPLPSPVSNIEDLLEVLLQSPERAVTRTSYFSPHFNMEIWQLVEADVQLLEAPVPSTAVALYKLAPKTTSQVAVTLPLEQL